MSDQEKEWSYRAFISYAREDKTWAEWCHSQLETFIVPKSLIQDYPNVIERVYPVFRDEDELQATANLDKTLVEALDGSECLVVLASPHARVSKYVDFEILRFKQSGRGDRIFVCIVGGEPNADAGDEEGSQECFPRALRFDPDQDGNLTLPAALPLAVDLRPGQEAQSDARLKLVAGILGVRFDDLKQRDRKRIRNRRKIQGFLAGILLLVMAFLIVFAEDKLRKAAESETAEINAIQEFAELATRYYGDIEPEERIRRLEDAQNRLMKVLHRRPLNQGDTGILRSAVKLLVELGKSKGTLLYKPEFKEFWSTTHLYAQELHRRLPNDEEAAELRYQTAKQMALAFGITNGVEAHTRYEDECMQLLDIARRNGWNKPEWSIRFIELNTSRANRYLQQSRFRDSLITVSNAVHVVETLPEAVVENEMHIPTLAYAYRQLGWTLNALNRYEEALQAFTRGLDILDQSGPDSVASYTFEGTRADFLRSMAGLLFARAMYTQEARQYLDEAIEILERISTHQEVMPRLQDSYRSELAIAFRERAQLLSALHEPGWERDLQKSHSELHGLWNVAPEDPLRNAQLAQSFAALGGIELNRRQFEAAREAFKMAVQHHKTSTNILAPANADRPLLQYLQGFIQAAMGLGDIEQASALLGERAQLLSTGRIQFVNDVDKILEESAQSLLEGDLFFTTRDYIRASTAFEASVNILAERVQKTPDNLNLVHQLVIAYSKLADTYAHSGASDEVTEACKRGLETLQLVPEFSRSQVWSAQDTWFRQRIANIAHQNAEQ